MRLCTATGFSRENVRFVRKNINSSPHGVHKLYKGYHVDKWITLWITLCWVDFLFENLNRIPDGIRGFYLRRNFFGTVKDGGMIAAA